MNFTYRNARRAVQEALDNATTEKGLNRVNRFITAGTCPECLGARLSEKARGSEVTGLNLAQATSMTLDKAVAWAPTVPATLRADMGHMAENLVVTLLTSHPSDCTPRTLTA